MEEGPLLCIYMLMYGDPHWTSSWSYSSHQKLQEHPSPPHSVLHHYEVVPKTSLLDQWTISDTMDFLYGVDNHFLSCHGAGAIASVHSLKQLPVFSLSVSIWCITSKRNKQYLV